MIVDKLENAALYSAVSPRLDEAFKWLRTQDLGSLDAGTITIREGELLAIVQAYETVPEAGRRFETHRRFIDIQYVVSGSERLLATPAESLLDDGPYDDEKDLAFHHPGRTRSSLVLGAGMFAVFFPQDAHMPMLQVAESGPDARPEPVRKIVLKVAV